MTYDPKRLAALGRRRKKLLADTAGNMAEIRDEIAAAREAKRTQDQIAHDSGLSRVTVQKILKELEI